MTVKMVVPTSGSLLEIVFLEDLRFMRAKLLDRPEKNDIPERAVSDVLN
jgi:hypothetical protein